MRVKLLTDQARVPLRAHPRDAGADLFTQDDYLHVLYVGKIAVVPLGISIEIPDGWVGLICPRSGLAAKYGVTVLNAPGVIDHGYTGEVKVVLYNAGPYPVEIVPSMRIAQLLLTEVKIPLMDVVTDFQVESERGMAGFGSTGM